MLLNSKISTSGQENQPSTTLILQYLQTSAWIQCV